ncbi:hypothetical protein BSKO_06533 [Bryopsis sp. KO-2023]|nr:hypothetical protein BSKO_06533 [Bryopsis sp. KO-2023]
MSRLACLSLLLLLGWAAGQRLRNDLDGDCVPAVPQDAKDLSFFPDGFKLEGEDGKPAVDVEIAEDFKVEYGPNFKVVTNLRADETYVLYQCGTNPPEKSLFPGKAKMFEIPLTSVSVADTTFIGFMELLEVEDRTSFASSFASSPCFQKLASDECGKVAGDPGSQFANQEAVNAQDGKVDAIISTSASSSPNTIAFTATADPSVLKRAEWIKFVSLFFNKEVKANQVYDGAKQIWNRLKSSDNGGGPVIAWIGFQDFNGPEIFLHFADYKVEYVQAAGGRTLDRGALKKDGAWKEVKNGFTSTSLGAGRKSLAKLFKDVDVVIDETFTPNNAKYTLDTFKSNFAIEDDVSHPFLENKKVFRVDGRVSPGAFGDGLEWFELPVARPDQVLKDFLQAAGSDKAKDHTRVWLRNIALEESVTVVTSQACGGRVKNCAFEPKVICPSVVATCDDSLEFRSPTDTGCPAPRCSKN